MLLKKIYSLYNLHGRECLWAWDHRVSRPDGTSELTDKQFYIIEQLIDNFTMLETCMYSGKMEAKIQKDIDNLKTKFTIEVFELLKKKYLTK